MFQAILKVNRRFKAVEMPQLHQDIYKAAGSGTGPGTAPREFLFRDYDCSGGTGVILRTCKELRTLPGWNVACVTPFQPVRSVGDELEFRIRVHATTNIKPDTPNVRWKKRDVYSLHIEKLKSQKVSPWPSREEILEGSVGEWFRFQGASKGFEVVVLGVGEGLSYDFQKPDGQRVRYRTHDISGLLKVTDPKAFAETLTKGIGSKRTYGCGLLLVK